MTDSAELHTLLDGVLVPDREQNEDVTNRNFVLRAADTRAALAAIEEHHKQFSQDDGQNQSNLERKEELVRECQMSLAEMRNNLFGSVPMTPCRAFHPTLTWCGLVLFRQGATSSRSLPCKEV